jgi:hypothetical protein
MDHRSRHEQVNQRNFVNQIITSKPYNDGHFQDLEKVFLFIALSF